jgi:hypothetical protein
MRKIDGWDVALALALIVCVMLVTGIVVWAVSRWMS